MKTSKAAWATAGIVLLAIGLAAGYWLGRARYGQRQDAGRDSIAEFESAAKAVHWYRAGDATLVRQLRKGEPVPSVEMKQEVWGLVQFRAALSSRARELYAQRCLAAARRFAGDPRQTAGGGLPCQWACEQAWNFSEDSVTQAQALSLFNAAQTTDQLDYQCFRDKMTDASGKCWERTGGIWLATWDKIPHLANPPE